MPSNTPNYNLAIYDNLPAGDQLENFLDYRTALAGVGATSNMALIDGAMNDNAVAITALEAKKNIIAVPAVYDSPNTYLATVSGYTAYGTNDVIDVVLDTDSDATVQININSLGLKSLMKINSSGTPVNLDNTNLLADRHYLFSYDGTRWIWIGATSADQIDIGGTAANLVAIASDGSLGDSAVAPSDLTLNTSTNISTNSWVLDEDDLSSDDDTKVPTQQSVKAYVDTYGYTKNKIIDGAMQVAQEGTSVSSITADGYPAGGVDLVFLGISGMGSWTFSQEQDTFKNHGFSKSAKVYADTATVSPPASGYARMTFLLSGDNLQDVQKGLAGAKKIQVQFYVKSNVTGTYIAELYDVDNDRHVSSSFAIASSGVTQKVEIDFPADTTGELTDDNTAAIYLNVWFSAGSNYTSGTLGTSWQALDAVDRAVGQVNLASSIGNYLEISGAGLYAGDALPEFKHIRYSDVLNTVIDSGGFYYLTGGAGDLVFSCFPETTTLTSIYTGVRMERNPAVTSVGTPQIKEADEGNKNVTSYSTISSVGGFVTFQANHTAFSGFTDPRKVRTNSGGFKLDARL